ncbi:LamG-like jellyroll fold domain-containing protein [Gillisia hiemivivida]|uniref:PKD domain-containing protein n=1 Tax=Gillisia hiemivivida TaxID=291190 RepID=A0A5C6ZPJ7_9FLAO|nr:LamG-like jellyroll fold domain-containing protein [Gillisia hiemivivida]TXD92596.1 hypothetical protein ES724_13230 [Gillisia hiemivivida]
MGKITLWVKINIFLFLFGFTSQIYSFSSTPNNFNENYGEGICYVFMEAPTLSQLGPDYRNNDNFNDKAAEFSISITITDASCSDKADGSLSATVSGGQSSYSYKWTGPDNFTATGATINNLKPGSYTVQVTDVNDNNVTQSKTTTLSFTDSQNPTVLTKDITIQLGASGNVSIAEDAVNNGSTDTCGGLTYATNITAFDCTDVGVNTVILTVTDANNQSATGNATVTVQDVNPPNVITKNITIQLDASGNATIAEDTVNSGSSDACAGLTYDTNITSFDCTDVGANTVELTVTDANGNSSSANAVVTVEDKIAPNVITKDITVQLDASGNATIAEVAVNNSSVDACGGLVYDTNITSFDCTDVGANTVELTVTDANGNSSSANAVVTVEDKIAPNVITKDITIQLDASGNATIAEDSVNNGSYDACAGLSFATNITSFDCTDVGANTVELTVTDVNRNSSSANAVVTVEDKIAPNVITKDITVQLDASGNGTIAENAVNNGSADACGGLVYDTNITSFDCTNVGPNSVELTVTDSNGNTDKKTAIVKVEDKIAPNVITKNITIQLDSNGTANITPSQIDNDSNDACGIQSTALDITNFDCTNIGSNTVTLSVIDNNDNSNTGTATITVEDNIKPILPTVDNITWGCEYTVEPAVALDNCDGEIIGEPNRSTTFTETGTITWTFTDASGNSDSIEQTVTINQIELNVQVDDILCNGFASGEAQAIVTGGVGAITYDWGELGNGTAKDGLGPGTYSVTATDVNGCSTMKEFTISEPDSFIEITSIDVNKGCFEEDNASVTVDVQGGTGELTYIWSNGQTGATINNVNNSSPSNNLTLTITDENGCSIEENIILNAPEKLEITEVINTETTSFGSATGTATVLVKGGTPGYSFEWSNGKTDQTASNLPAGMYTVTVTDSNGCHDDAEVIIIDPISAIIVPTSICDGENEERRTSYFRVENNTAVGGYGSYSYDWDFGDPSDLVNPPTENGPNLIQVKYKTTGSKTIKLTVTDQLGNEFQTIIQQYVGECFEINCGSSDGSFDIENIYLGDSSGKKITADNCSENVTKFLYFRNLSNRKVYSLYIEYIYTVTNGDTGEIREEPETLCLYEYEEVPELVKLAQVNWNCGDDIQLENVLILFSQNKNRACGEGSSPKCYGSNDQGEIIIPLYANAYANELLCNGASNGKITVKASGGSPTYSYKLISAVDDSVIRDNPSSEIFEELEAGSYRVIISDSSDPQNTFETEVLEINQPSTPLTLTETNRSLLACYNGKDAEVSVRVSGGTAPYTIIWSNGQSSTTTESTVSNLPSGVHSVEVIDAYGCKSDYLFEIAEPEELFANAGNDQVLGCGVNQVKLGGVFNGYTNPRTGEEEFGNWRIINGPGGAAISEPNNPESLFTITTTGTYTLEWTIPCGSTDRVKIIFSNCSTIDFDGVDDYIDFGNNLNLSSGFTLEAWVKQDQNASTSIKTILSKRDNANLSTGGYDLIIENNTPKFRWNNETISSTHQIDSDRWYHIAVVQGGNDAGIYIDGIKASESAPGTPNNIDKRFLIGAMHDSTSEPLPNHFFHGWIEEIRVWNTSLDLVQLKFMMNQRIKNNTNVRGEIIDLDVPNNLKWENLTGYYRLITSEATNGITKNKIPNGIDGRLKNIQSTQQNTAPLPYIATGGDWWNINSWKQPQVWDTPNSTGVNGEKINWNIAKLDGKTLTNTATTDNSNSITLLGLLDDGGHLNMKGENNSSGNSLTITHYLKLDGQIDLNGESQLVQTEGSIIEGSGSLERDQQGTASSFNYNYWSSPVVSLGKNTYTIASVMMDGTDLDKSEKLNIGPPGDVTFADGAYASPRKISGRWLYSFLDKADEYSAWSYLGKDGELFPGEGYTMKGTSGRNNSGNLIPISDLQNYTFKGFPNNGIIAVKDIKPNQNYLLGNPYPSAISVEEFILDNIKVGAGRNENNLMNGAIYLWDHFGGSTHILREYVGGYAVRNILDGVPAISTDDRIDSNGNSSNKIPGPYIPVGQGFFVNTTIDSIMGVVQDFSTGKIVFKNSQRIFQEESISTDPNSQFLSQETQIGKEDIKGKRSKIRLDFRSPMGYHRQILVGTSEYATNGFDLGYDAALNDYSEEDFFWLINNYEYVIQGVENFNPNQVLPIGIYISKKGEFKIEINKLESVPEETNIYLLDLETEEYFDLRKSGFTMEIEPGAYYERFQIVFEKKDDESEEAEEGETEEESNPDVEEEGSVDPKDGEDLDTSLDIVFMTTNRELAIINPDNIAIQKVVIYNLLGQKIQEYENIENKKMMTLGVKEFPMAVYLVKMYSEKGEMSKNIILMK